MVNGNRHFVARFVALACLLLIYALARLPSPSESRAALASRYRFEIIPLPALHESRRTLRPVRKSLQPIAAWISSVGAAIALHDFDGDGLSNDVAYVDVRTDEVVIAPAPGTGERFAPFDLLRASGCAAVGATAPMGVVPGDVNEDGLADAVVYFWGRSPLIYTRRDAPLGPNAFDCREAIEPRQEWYTNAAAFADVDGDGHADLVIGNYFRDRSGVLDPRSTSAEMQMQDSMSRAFNGGANHLLLWTRDGFRDVPHVFPEEIARGWTLALGAQDLDGDLLPEIYFANDFGPDHLLHNLSLPGHPRFEPIEGSRTFFDPRSKVLGRDSFKGMGVDFADVNGDAIPDFFVSNITDSYALEESSFLFVSSGNLRYHDESEPLGVSRSGWGWDARFGDFDNDGVPEMLQATGFIRGETNRWPELHELAMTNDDLVRRSNVWPHFVSGGALSSGNRNPFFARADDGRWYDVAEALHMPAGTISRGIATGDVDGDGRLDFAVANQWQTSELFRNTSPVRGHALELHLRLGTQTIASRGVPSHLRASPAIGASARVIAGGRTLIAQVDGGNGHSGKRAPELHFGLGDAKDAVVEIAWRDRHGHVARRRFHLAAGVWTILLASKV